MKGTDINTQKFEIVAPSYCNNNELQFPKFSGSTTVNYTSTITYNHGNTVNYIPVIRDIKYVLCLDWLEFVCSWDEPIELSYINNIVPDIVIETIGVHPNTNFRYLHRIFVEGVEVCDIYSSPINRLHAYNEVSVKISNYLLYTGGYQRLLNKILDAFGLTYARMVRIDIALDGADILKIMGYLNKYYKSHTIQIKDDRIKILPTAFDKSSLTVLEWAIGSKKSGISAIVYGKTDELIVSGKKYIADFWSKNGIPAEGIGRFEIQLNGKRLKKYCFDISNIELLSDAGFLGAIFIAEVKPWLILYRVRKVDYLNLKKENAINNGHEIPYIKWDKLPAKSELLGFSDCVSERDRTNARNMISFLLKDIHRNPSCTTTAWVEVIQKFMNDYNLNEYVSRKIDDLFFRIDENQSRQLLKNLVFRG